MATSATPELAPAPGRHWSDAAIRSVHDVASDVRMIEIEPSAGVRAYPTGSHLDIAVEVEGLPDLRSYSLVGEGPVDGAYRIAVKEIPDSRGGSVWVRGLQPGAGVQVSEPSSNFELQYGRSEYLLIAGGIGITPIYGMAHALERHRRPFRLLYAAHTREQMPFVAELSELLGDRLELFVSAEGNRLDLDAEIERLDPDGELYLCGPLRLRDAAQREWKARGRRRDRLQFETFASGGAFAPEAFVCRMRDADREVSVRRNRTLLDALRDDGVEMIWDCLRGECGLCAATVVEVEGKLDHRDVFLSEEQKEEGDTIITCVSRAVGGAITIDTGFRPDSVDGFDRGRR
ncbi:MAG: PDR/VanB family oxidoreductase [Solirubrobacterales bacterium]|nr:PDR/VanB family oxidoreductase [Solirubrobacterales bacterium]